MNGLGDRCGPDGVYQSCFHGRATEPTFSAHDAELRNGTVMGDLNSRRGRIEGMELRGTTQIIKSSVPLSEMFGYATELRSRTQGRGSFTMHFGRYEEVPNAIAEEIVSKVQGKVSR